MSVDRRKLLGMMVLPPPSALSAKVFGKQIPIVGTDAPAGEVPTFGRAGMTITGLAPFDGERWYRVDLTGIHEIPLSDVYLRGAWHR